MPRGSKGSRGSRDSRGSRGGHCKMYLSQMTKCICLKSQNVFVSKCKIQGVFFNWPPPKKLKYLEPRLGESTST